MAAIRRADLARRNDRIGAPARASSAARFWYPYRGGSTDEPGALRPMALLPGAPPLGQERSSSAG
eukprot:12103944-Alexandrium_andersonii.AAC.1